MISFTNVIIGLGIVFLYWDIQKVVKKLNKYLDIKLDLLDVSITDDK